MTIKKKVSVWFVSLKVLEATFCVGVKTKLPTRNPVCLRETPVKVCRQRIPGTALTHYGLLIQMQNISLRSSGISRNFLSSPLFSLFRSHFFFLAGHLVGFILVGNGTRFSWRFSGQCYMVFCLFLRCP